MASLEMKDIEEIDDLLEMCHALATLGISHKGLKTLDEMKERARAALIQPSEKTTSSPVQQKMASPKIEDLEKITNMMEMCEVLAKLGISLEGVQTIDQMRALAIAEIAGQSSEKPSWSPGQTFSIISKAKIEDERKRKRLLDLFSQADTVLSVLDGKDFPSLQQTMDSTRKEMKCHINQLKQKGYYILVAGETSAGKSTLINLILGEELLPCNVLATTSTICELKYGKERNIVLHFEDRGLQAKTIPLMDPAKSSRGSYQNQISTFVKDAYRSEGSVYHKIEIFWPHQLLEEGIVIIDSPGIGESEHLNDIVIQYLRQAFAFIYVIDTSRGGGVQDDRILQLMQHTRSKILEESYKRSEERKGGTDQEHAELPSLHIEFENNCALLVCNKWDLVKKEETEKVKNVVVEKLKKCWPGIDPDRQIICMSAQIATTVQKHGKVSNYFLALMNGIESLVFNSIGTRLEIHLRWLYDFLSQVSNEAGSFVINASSNQEEVQQKLETIRDRLDDIKKRRDQIKNENRRRMTDSIDCIVQKLLEYLKSDDVRKRFTNWTQDEVPSTFQEVTKAPLNKILHQRLVDIIKHWEEDSHEFDNALESLLSDFKQSFDFLKGQLRDLKGAVTGDILSVPEIDLLPNNTNFFNHLLIKLFWGVHTLADYVTFGVLKSSIYEVIKQNPKATWEEIEKICQWHWSDKCAFMKTQSAKYLDKATEKAVLEPLVKGKLADAEHYLKYMEVRISEKMEGDEKQYKQQADIKRSKEESLGLYSPILNEASGIRGNVAQFWLTEACAADIRSEELEWNEQSSNCLDRGASTTVFQGKMTSHGVKQPVALKVYKETLSAKNASHVIDKANHLREFVHPNIVKFYGTALFKETNTIRPVLVMEMCTGNLRNHIESHPASSVPGISWNEHLVRKQIRWIEEIADALGYIHRKGYTHQDLTLENILLSADTSVRITNVGISKQARNIDVTGTWAGSIAYMAPEVFYSRLYDDKADIYSFGLLMWEIWFGQRAFAEVEAPDVQSFFRLIDTGYRPGDVGGLQKPPFRWQALMEKCWHGDKEKRPTADACKQKITQVSRMRETGLKWF